MSPWGRSGGIAPFDQLFERRESFPKGFSFGESKMTDFYVYIHRKAATGEIFYVGKGKDLRYLDRSNRNTWWENTVSKYGFNVEFVETCLQEWYALELEIELIALYGRKDLGLGPLVNLTDGGEGTSGHACSEEHRAKLSAAWVDPERRLKHSEIQKEAWADPDLRSRQSEFMSHIRIGKTHSEETKLKIGRAHLGHSRGAGSKRTLETREKMSASMRGNTNTLGKTHSAETIIKMKEAWVKRKANKGITQS